MLQEESGMVRPFHDFISCAMCPYTKSQSKSDCHVAENYLCIFFQSWHLSFGHYSREMISSLNGRSHSRKPSNNFRPNGKTIGRCRRLLSAENLIFKSNWSKKALTRCHSVLHWPSLILLRYFKGLSWYFWNSILKMIWDQLFCTQASFVL